MKPAKVRVYFFTHAYSLFNIQIRSWGGGDYFFTEYGGQTSPSLYHYLWGVVGGRVGGGGGADVVAPHDAVASDA